MKTNPSSHQLGLYFETSDVIAFFGNRLSSREALESAFPQYRFIALKQTHSDRTIASPFTGEAPDADAHFTREPRAALCIRTADCIPVLLFEPHSRTIAAVHAGWRGIENEIILKTCARLKSEGMTLTDAYAWIGPHIGPESFEVGQDVATQLEQRFQNVSGFSDRSTSLLPHSKPEKARVDLLSIARAQLLSVGLSQARVRELCIDTVTSNEHESFRRDRDKSGRQISFIVLKS